MIPEGGLGDVGGLSPERPRARRVELRSPVMVPELCKRARLIDIAEEQEQRWIECGNPAGDGVGRHLVRRAVPDREDRRILRPRPRSG